jgi:class 3 adenylate cyclase
MSSLEPDQAFADVGLELGEPHLLYADGDGVERRYTLEPGRAMTIGRGGDADLSLPWDHSVSSIHAEASPVGSHWVLNDDHLSRNGTFVNDERVRARRRLRDGDVIRVGQTRLLFRHPASRSRDVTTLTDAFAVTGLRTLLFTDLAGSTELLDRLGDDAGERFMHEHFETLRRALDAHGGQEVKNLGDGLMAAFPSALNAVACARRMQRDVAVDAEAAEPVGLRIGLNAGEVMIAEDGEDYFGTPVVVAKRLCDRADPGQTLVSGMVQALVGSREEHGFVSLGRMDLKGIAEPVEVFTLA